MSTLRKMPKVELHRHLDGSIRQQTIMDIARTHNLDIDISDSGQLFRNSTVTEPMKDLASVLSVFNTIQKVTCSYEAIKRITFENVEDCYQDGVVLSELRFSPAFIGLHKNIGNDEIIEGVIDGMNEGMRKYDIQVGLITIVSRSLDYEANRQGTEDAVAYATSGKHSGGDRIVGFDLADVENTTKPDDFLGLVNMARRAGLGITVHSGEDTGPEGVERTLETLKPDRIGHGVNAWRDRGVVEQLIEQDMLLEICPTSNWLTQCVKQIESHPLPDFYRSGVKVSINSDDPQLMDIDLVHEYELCQKLFGFDADDFQRMNVFALEKSFLDEELKSVVEKQYFS